MKRKFFVEPSIEEMSLRATPLDWKEPDSSAVKVVYTNADTVVVKLKTTSRALSQGYRFSSI